MLQQNKFKLEKAPLPSQSYNLEELQPAIKCHCCNDSGKIQPHLVRTIISNYDPQEDRQPICQREECGLGLKFTTLIEMDLVDLRFNPEICEHLHEVGKSEKEVKQQKPDNLIEYQEMLKKREMKKYQQSNLSGRQWEQMQGEKYYGN